MFGVCNLKAACLAWQYADPFISHLADLVPKPTVDHYEAWNNVGLRQPVRADIMGTFNALGLKQI